MVPDHMRDAHPPTRVWNRRYFTPFANMIRYKSDRKSDPVDGKTYAADMAILGLYSLIVSVGALATAYGVGAGIANIADKF